MNAAKRGLERELVTLISNKALERGFAIYGTAEKHRTDRALPWHVVSLTCAQYAEFYCKITI